MHDAHDPLAPLGGQPFDDRREYYTKGRHSADTAPTTREEREELLGGDEPALDTPGDRSAGSYYEYEDTDR